MEMEDLSNNGVEVSQTIFPWMIHDLLGYEGSQVFHLWDPLKVDL
jgi:hypothetical protein